MSLSIDSTAEGSKVRVAARGEVDVSNAGELRDALDAALAEKPAEIECDLAEVPYIDSTGIGVLVGVAHRAKEAGARFAVARPQRNVARVLGMLGVTDELNIQA